MKEEWKIIEEFPKYKISNTGKIYSTTNKALLNFKVKKGRVVFRLSKNDKKYERFLSRLLAVAFIPNPDDKEQVNHIDEDPLNNNLSNLEWMTPKENINHGTRNERASKALKKTYIKPVYQYTKELQLVNIYYNCRDTTRDGFNFSSVAACCRGDRKSHKDYVWSLTPL